MLNTLPPAEQIQKMLSIIYQIPMGLVEADFVGNVRQINAKGIQLLMPVFLQEKLPINNIVSLLQVIAPGVIKSVQAYTLANGCIVDKQREAFNLVYNGENHKKYFFFTVNKLSPESYMYIFDDVTEAVEREIELNKTMQEKAVERSKFEMAAEVLHDIGNAVVGFGSYLMRIKRSAEQNDIATLQKLKLFIEKQKPAIANSIGGAKADAMVNLIAGIIVNQEAGIGEVKKCLTEQMGIISHIQEILNIQRQYLKGQGSARIPVNLRSVINDSIAMLFAAFDSKGIAITADMPGIIPLIKGDTTKLMQVFLNLLKNAAESVEALNAANKYIQVTVVVKSHAIEITIVDTGIGFEGIGGERFFEKGVTSKTTGNGLGLANCKSIIESHQGTIQLQSKGLGLGAVAVICFNI